MNSRLGNILYGAGLVGVAISLFYVVDAIWVHQSGGSLLPISGRYMSREDMLAAIATGVMLALLSAGAGEVARYYVNKLAEKQPDPDQE